MVSKNIVQSSLDDDVMTDEEMIECANKVLNREVDKAIKQFSNGLDRSFIKNLNIWMSAKSRSDRLRLQIRNFNKLIS